MPFTMFSLALSPFALYVSYALHALLAFFVVFSTLIPSYSLGRARLAGLVCSFGAAAQLADMLVEQLRVGNASTVGE